MEFKSQTPRCLLQHVSTKIAILLHMSSIFKNMFTQFSSGEHQYLSQSPFHMERTFNYDILYVWYVNVVLRDAPPEEAAA